jgi:glycosyltransferase involved in cell wall biosynthesis
MRILLIDPVCPTPYALKTLEEKTLGGTEATCIRLCRELAKRDKVYLVQRNRTERLVEDGITYLPHDSIQPDAQVCITLRDSNVLKAARARLPGIKHYLWMHDTVSGAYRDYLLDTLPGHKCDFIVGSMWQQAQLIDGFGPRFDPKNWTIKLIPNFIEDYCTRGEITYDPYKLIFTSSPHKGLDHVLKLFQHLKKREPKYQLYIANPGYFESIKEVPEGVHNLGIVKHRELMTHVASSLCLFYPNVSFAETFGLVYAEANAVGTPVLCHNVGAASEVVSTPLQVIDCTNLDLVADTVIRWSNGERPIVKVKEDYTIKEAIKIWRKTLNPMRLIKE